MTHLGAVHSRPWPMATPPHWSVKRLKWSIAEIISGVWGDEPDGVNDLTCVRVADFDRTRFVVNEAPPTQRAIRPDERVRRILQHGDLLLEKSGGGDKQPVGCVVEFSRDFPSVCSNFVGRMPMARGMWPRYWTYVHASLYAGRLNVPAINQTTGIQNLDVYHYFNQRVPFPPPVEQRAIADYLDRETARLDALVAAKERVVGLLAERRQAAISHTVTRGVVAGAPLRDSGVAWISEVPAHWVTGNIRRFAAMKTGHTPSRTEPDYWLDCDIPWFTLADVWQLRDGKQSCLGETKEMISALGLANSAAELLPTGTVVFSRTASVGFSGIMPRPMATSQDFWNWIPGPNLIPEYLLFLFRAMKQEFARMTMGSTHKTVYQPDAANLGICVPPIEEQYAIVDAIKRETARIDGIISATQRSIALIKERRSALISAAVTGALKIA